MTTRFNPPPGWPLAGLGALPRADWTPDPGTPAAPSSWPFYVDDRGYVTTPPIGTWQPPVDVAPVAVTAAAEPPSPTAPGRHRQARRRPRWSHLFVTLPLTALSVVVVLLGVLAALR